MIGILILALIASVALSLETTTLPPSATSTAPTLHQTYVGDSMICMYTESDLVCIKAWEMLIPPDTHYYWEQRGVQLDSFGMPVLDHVNPPDSRLRHQCG